MNDENVIAMLRGAAVGGPAATGADVQAATGRGRRIRRRRQIGGAVGSALTVSGFVALLTLAAPNGQTVVQGATAGPNQPGIPDQLSIRRSNMQLLQHYLGPQNWRLNCADNGGDVSNCRWLDLIPGSPAASGLSSDYVAHAVAKVGTAPTDPALRAQLLECSHTGSSAYFSCLTGQTDQGGAWVMDHRNSGSVQDTEIRYLRADGVLVNLGVNVTSEAGSPSATDQKNVAGWLAQFEPSLLSASTDPSFATEFELPTADPTPLPTSAGSPAPAATTQAIDAAQCDASAISLTLGPNEAGISQQEPLALVLHNNGSNTCELRGFPKIRLREAGGSALPFRYVHTGDQVFTGGPAPTVVIEPGGSAYLGFDKQVCETEVTQEKQAVSVSVTLPGTSAPKSFALPHALDWCSETIVGSTVAVAPIEPTEQALWAHRRW